LRSVFLNLANVVVISGIMLPLMALFLGSLQTEGSLLNDPYSLRPRELTAVNFQVLFGMAEGSTMYVPAPVKAFGQAFLNSIIVALATTLGVLVLGSLSAYAVTRLRFRGNRSFVYALLFSRMVPVIVLLIPLFLALRAMNLLNTLAGVIITEVGFIIPYAVWILMTYFASLPSELEDAARIDGCTRFGSFVRIVLPLSAPGMASCAVITFMLSWQELLIPLVVTAKPELMTIPVVLASLVSDVYVEYTLMTAIAVVGLLPSVVIAILMQRYVVKGLTAGAVKG
jgi:multiple sugar transport system permease protein